MNSTSKCKLNKTAGNNTNLSLLPALFVFVTGVSHAEGFGDILLKEVVKGIQNQSQQVQNPATSSSTNQQAQVSPPTNGNNTIGTASSLYSGEARWGVGTGMIYDSSGDASMTVALKTLANPKAPSKMTAKEYFTTMEIVNDTKGQYPWLISFLDDRGVEVKPKLLSCFYKETLDTRYQKPYRTRVVQYVFWSKGTRILLHPTMQRNFEQYSHKLIDVEAETCPSNLALAFEAGLGANVWNEIEPKFQENFSTNLQSHREYLINMKKNGGKEKTNKGW